MADMWELAQQNADVLRISTLFVAQDVPKYLAEDEGIDRAISWCREHGITHVYIESFRTEAVPPRDVLERARDRFRQAGFLVSGCITPAGFGKRSTGWRLFSCYTSQQTQRELRAMSEYAAGLFDQVMIDDFLCSDCECDECRGAKGERSWAQYKCDLMLRLSRTHIIEAGRAVNPDVEFIIKYPCWHESLQERGYDVDRQTALFSMTWVGTETRGVEGQEAAEPRWPAEPQYRAYWLMRWLLGIGGEECGGGWHDSIGTTPLFYLEQARQTVLGGAREMFLFNFSALYEGSTYDRHRGPEDVAALREELPLHFELARLIRGKEPRGLLGWKPMNSPAGPDGNLHSLLGMAGFPVIAAHEFDPDAPGFVFGHHVLHDPDWRVAGERAWNSGRPILVTPAFLEEARRVAAERGVAMPQITGQLIALPACSKPNRWEAIESMPEAELDALRDRACGALGLRFHAPAGVAVYLFGDDVAVVENFRDEPTRCELTLDGWSGFEVALQMPAGEPVRLAQDGTVRFLLPRRSLLALRSSQ